MLRSQKGTYLFIFLLREELLIKTKGGKSFFLPKGIYVYVGSAFGKGGLKARIERHLKRNKKLHWHLDYITTTDKWVFLASVPFEGKKWECKIARLLEKFGFEPIKGFGCSDCSCTSHLFRLSP